jgi:hypothetical protein
MKFDKTTIKDPAEDQRLLGHEQTRYQATKSTPLCFAGRSLSGVLPGNGQLGSSSPDSLGARRGHLNSKP